MKTFVPEEKTGLTVGEIIDAMHASGDYAPLGREDIFAVVEIFIREYVGLPGEFVSKKFTADEAKSVAEGLNITLEQVIKIVTVFRLRAGKQSEVKTKLAKLISKVRMKGGTKSTVTSRM